MRFNGQPKRLVVGSALNVWNRDLREVIDSEGRRKISGIGQDDAERGANRAHLHANEGALATLKLNTKMKWHFKIIKLLLKVKNH